MAEQKQRRHRRTKANIVASIEKAAKTEIAQNGFVSALVTNIIRNAEIEPQVFYNRYKDIDEFNDAYVRKYDNFIADLLEGLDESVTTPRGISSLLKGIFDAINDDPVMLELIRWEICERNNTTTRSALLRELSFQPLVQGIARQFKGAGIDVPGIMAVLVGGIYFVSLHKRQAPFFGIDIATEEGKNQVHDIIDQIVTLVFEASNEAGRNDEIAQRLRSYGMNEDVTTSALSPVPVNAAPPSANQPKSLI